MAFQTLNSIFVPRYIASRLVTVVCKTTRSGIVKDDRAPALQVATWLECAYLQLSLSEKRQTDPININRYSLFRLATVTNSIWLGTPVTGGVGDSGKNHNFLIRIFWKFLNWEISRELLEQAHQEVIFYPKFHCELNFIERFWCGAKFYSREHCGYSFESLREVLPAALDSVSIVSIYRYYCHSMRILNAYSNGLSYGTKEFVDKVYKGHRQVVDKTKW